MYVREQDSQADTGPKSAAAKSRDADSSHMGTQRFGCKLHP